MENKMDDLLKDAIADAKAVRETALANAKVALEEAFTPRLKSMLSQKIQAEMEEDDVEERMEDDEKDEAMHGDDEDPEERMKINADDEDPSDDHSEEMEPEDKEVEERGDDEVDESEIIEIDGVKYAPLKTEEEDEEEKDESVEEGEHEDKEDDVDEDLDLEAVLAELEADINEEEEDEKDESVSEGEHEDDEKKDESVNEEDEDDEKNEEVDEEVDHSSGIGSGDNKKGAADKSSGIGSVGKAKLKENEDVEEDVEEDIDLDEILSALSEEEEVEEQDNRVEELSKELEEHRDVVKYLRGKLNEVNLLNAKLLFSNKLFRAYGLNNEQKLKVVETFDRAANLREVKLVYSTLAESFGAKKNETVNESKGSASKAVASTQKPKEVIQEGSALRDRFKKLANIL
jgi:hypothetical protein|tara:strand:- start:1315 stop:2523 length:1209 start_codon:yes stop_codon:yes gene_type:complete